MTDRTEHEPQILRGEFTVIDNRLHVTTPQIEAAHELAAAHRQMVLELSTLAVPRIHVDPEPEEFEDVADYLVRAAAIVDRWLKSVGEEAKSNSTVRLDMSSFEDQLSSAIQGFATFELDRAAEALRDERNSYASETDYRRAARIEGARP